MAEQACLRVVVTGGAGFLGQAVVQQLLSEGHLAVVYDRVVAPVNSGADVIAGDVRDRSGLISALGGADAVIHAAFAPPQASQAELREVNVDAARTVAEVSARAGVRHLVVVSSTIVEREPRPHPFSGRVPLSRLDSYRRTRCEGEEAALGWSGELDVSIARPSTFLGPGRVGAFALIFEAVRAGGFVPILGPGTNRYQLLHVDDLASGLIRLVEGSHHGVFHFGAHDVLTVRAHLSELVSAAESGSRIVSLHSSLARPLVRVPELLGLPPLSDWHHASARVEDRVSTTSRAHQELGWHSAASNSQCLLDAYRWYQHAKDAGLATPTTHPVARSHRVSARVLRMARGARS